MPPNEPTLTAASAMRRLARCLDDAGIDTPELDARLLVEAASGLSRAAMIRDPDEPLTPAAADRLAGLAARRLAREPVSRILGERSFYGRDFTISPETLDPRPDTETLIEAALGLMRPRGWDKRPIRILDVGTGSGAILVTLLAELPLASGLGTDISAGALRVASANAERHAVAARAEFSLARSLSGIRGRFDLLVSNPPYIPTQQIPALEPEVKDHDPIRALDGGPDGLDVYREIAAGLVRVVPDGIALFEVGAGQAEAVATLMSAAAGGVNAGKWWQWNDLSGHTRCVAVGTHN